jgi:predicted nucleic acid-binding protein
MAFVLDASVAISWCFPGDPAEDTPYSRRILEMLATDNALVPQVWAYEIANVIFVASVLRKRIFEAQIAEYMALLKALPIQAEPVNIWDALGIEAAARRWNLAAYDAAYLALAKDKQLSLATSDVKLRTVAEAQGIQVL